MPHYRAQTLLIAGSEQAIVGYRAGDGFVTLGNPRMDAAEVKFVPAADYRWAVKALERIAKWPVGKAYPSHEIIEYAAEEVARLTTGVGQSDGA